MVSFTSALLKAVLLGCFGILFLSPAGFGQNILHRIDTASSQMTILGASNLKKWNADVPVFDGTFEINSSADTAFNVQFSCISEAIDGGHGPDMNAKIKKALQATSHPKIHFTAEYIVLQPDRTFEGLGLLEIAGIQAPIEIAGSIDDAQIQGSSNFTLSLFSIDPPSAMFGSIVCKDDIQIEWQMNYSKIAQ